MAAIHIVFGASAAANLRTALNTYAQKYWQEGEAHLEYILGATVLNCTDCYAIGPVYEMDLPSGFYARLSWIGKYLEDNLLEDETLDDVDDILERISDFYKKLAWIEPGRKVVLWHGQNVTEQMGVRCLSTLIPEVNFYEVNLNDALEELPWHVGECSEKQLVPLISEIKAISSETLTTWRSDWEGLLQNRGVLRLWNEFKVETVRPDYFDGLLMMICKNEPVLADQVVESIMNEYICEAGAAYLTHRLRRLVEAHVLRAKGHLNSQKSFWVWKP